jgi:hypothetical protein
MIFYWEFSDDYVTMMISTTYVSWFGLGFGSAMNAAQDMWIFEIKG